jgi:OOP family OmpA-OmpF porin
MRHRALFACAVLLLASRIGLAQSAGPSLDLRGFHASTDPGAGLYLEPAETPATGEWNAGLWLSYAYRPITLRNAATGKIASDVISHQVTSDLIGNVGIAHRFAFGFDLPVLLLQSGDTIDPRVQRMVSEVPLPGQALGDLGLDGKFTVIRPTGEEFGGFALALQEHFTVPTGDEASYLGEGSVTSETRFLVEYRVVTLGVFGAAGLKLRGSQERYACNATMSDESCLSRFGHELPFGLGFSVKPQIFGVDPGGHLTLYLETHGHLPLSPIGPFDSAAVASLQASVGVRYALRDLSFFAGIETAMIGGIGDARLRAVMAVGFAPRNHDVDGDGIDDDVDECRELPEDKDGFEDRDGCPDADNDDDGVPDTADKCPSEKEDEDGFQDDDGCPDPDNDSDGISDVADKCPNEVGPSNAEPMKNGCPTPDPDGDRIEGAKDKCPDQAEDKDAFQDDDGCPDPDNDGDGISDIADKCPNEKGALASRGCPEVDPDKDTFLGQEDKCPDQPEVWNGIDDDDGCPDADPKGKAQPLIAVKQVPGKGPILTASSAVKFTAANEIEAPSRAILRAISAELLAHPDWSISVGARPSPKGGDSEAKARASAIASTIQRFTRRDKAAAVVDWRDVQAAPRAAEFGIGLLLIAPETPPKAPSPALPSTPTPKPKP